MIVNLTSHTASKGVKKVARNTSATVPKWAPRTEGHNILTPGNINWISGKQVKAFAEGTEESDNKDYSDCVKKCLDGRNNPYISRTGRYKGWPYHINVSCRLWRVIYRSQPVEKIGDMPQKMACVLKCHYDHQFTEHEKKMDKEIIENLLMGQLENTYKGLGLSTKEDLQPGVREAVPGIKGNVSQVALR